MAEYRSLSHTRWDCKYHVVFIPKRRKKAIYGHVRRMLGETLRELAAHKEAEIVERASAAGSRSHVLEDTSEIRGIERGWVPEREERDHDRSVFCGKGEEFHGRELLGQRLLCVHGGTG